MQSVRFKTDDDDDNQNENNNNNNKNDDNDNDNDNDNNERIILLKDKKTVIGAIPFLTSDCRQ